MQLTILGASPACQNSGGNTAGYLLRDGETTLMIDCGSGTFGALQTHVDPNRLTAVLVSHLHADHTFDLIPFRYFLAFTAQHLGQAIPHPLLFFPPGGEATLLSAIAFQDPSPSFFRDTFDVQEYDPQAVLTVGTIQVTFAPMTHIAHTYAMRFTSTMPGSGTLVYSADTGPCAEIGQIARSADLFLCEAANPAGSSFPLHLTAGQAGQIAATAGVRHLLLTHRWAVYGPDTTIAEAAATFAGPITLAHEGMTLTI